MTDFPKDVLDISTSAFAKHSLRYPHVIPSYRQCMSAALSALEEAGYGVFRAGYVRALEAEIAALKKREAFVRRISPHVAQMLDEYDAPADATLSANGGRDE